MFLERPGVFAQDRISRSYVRSRWARLRSTRGSLFLAPLVDRRGGGWLLEFSFSIHFCTACVAVRQQRAFLNSSLRLLPLLAK